MWWYTLTVLAVWVLNSEARRVYDLYHGLSQIEILAVLPLLSLVPHLWSLTFGGGWHRLPRPLTYAAWVWVGGFLYALVTSILSGNMIAGSYEFVTFVFPIGVGLWVAADPAPFAVAYKRLTRMVFALATVSSVYGVIQYVFAPPWDTVWLRQVIQAGTTSFGLPYPFQIRVFSTLNDPGTFAFFLVAALLFVLPELTLRRPLLVMQVSIWFVAFGLTLVRTGWFMFALGAIAYIVLSPRRATFIGTFAVAAAIIAGLVTILPSAFGNDGMLTSLSNRFATLSDLDEDTSRRERQSLYNLAPQIIMGAPFGAGLGVLGSSTRLGAAQAVTDFDSGVLGRSLEMGIPGVILYALPQVMLLFGSLRLWTHARSINDEALQCIAGAAVAMLVAFVFLQFAHDANGFPTLTVWLLNGLAISALLPGSTRRRQAAVA